MADVEVGHVEVGHVEVGETEVERLSQMLRHHNVTENAIELLRNEAFDLESLNIMLDDEEELVWLYDQELDEHDILNIQITAINANIIDLINNNNNNNNDNDNDNNNNNYVDNL